ncbi:hypothetical protein ABB02_00592 [Clostridiaceae bacterium JG1575]|nr:hypothetical protein ABB02_00592 [Clostridiaceae bacterium JG1575]
MDGKNMEKQKKILNIISLVTLTLAVVFFVYGIRAGIFQSKDAMASFIRPFGIAAPIIYTIFITLQSIFMVVPGAVGNLGGILLFGPIGGIICNYIGNCCGSSVNFYLARRYGMNVVRLFSSEKTFDKYKKWLDADEKKFHKWFAVCIFLPLAPDDLLCYLAGMTRMPFRKFIIIILLGKPLGVIFYTLLLNFGFQRLLHHLH